MNSAQDMVTEASTSDDRKSLVSELFEIRKQITNIEERELRPLKQRKAQLEGELLFLLEVDEGLSYTGVGTVKVVEEVVPKVYDWDSLFNYITVNNRLDLLPARINSVPFRDIINVEGSLVGVESTTIRKLRVRKS